MAATVTDLEQQIRRAYWALANGRTWVLLTEVRDLIDATKGEIDAALRLMERQTGVHLAPEADQKQLTRADRDAAVRIGGRDKHLIAITR